MNFSKLKPVLFEQKHIGLFSFLLFFSFQSWKRCSQRKSEAAFNTPGLHSLLLEFGTICTRKWFLKLSLSYWHEDADTLMPKTCVYQCLSPISLQAYLFYGCDWHSSTKTQASCSAGLSIAPSSIHTEISAVEQRLVSVI